MFSMPDQIEPKSVHIIPYARQVCQWVHKSLIFNVRRAFLDTCLDI